MITESAFDAVWESVGGASSKSEHVFVLVDHAGCSNLLSRLRQSPSLRWISLFENSTEQRAIEVAPILIDLGHVDFPAPGAKPLLAWLHETCHDSNALLVIRSTRSHDKLAGSLKCRLDVLLPDDMPVLLRYFDTRVFASLMETFDAKQKASFCCIARQWWWLDRAGRLRTMNTDELVEDALRGPVVFTESQQARLIDNAEADAVAQEVVRTAPDLCSALSRGQLHELVGAALSDARGYGIESLPMQCLFCIVALERGADFHTQAPWRNELTAAQTQKRDFAWVVRQVEGTSS